MEEHPPHRCETADHADHPGRHLGPHPHRDRPVAGLRAEPQIGALEDGPRDGPPLRLVGVQQPRRRLAVHHLRQLPRQIDRVAHPQVQPLPARRVVDMGGVPDQEAGAHPEPGRDPAVETEHRRPHDLLEPRVHPEVVGEPAVQHLRFQRRVRLVGGLDGLLGLVHRRRHHPEQPATPARQWQDADETAPGQVQPHPPHPEIGVQHDIREHPALRIRPPPELQPQRLPDGAARAVRADQPARRHRLLAVRAPHRDTYPLTGVGQRVERAVPLDVHRVLGQRLHQQPLGLELLQRQRVREPSRPRCPRPRAASAPRAYPAHGWPPG